MGFFNKDNYVDVQERINRFWHEYPDGAIRTKLESLPDDFDTCRYAAKVYKQRDSPEPDAVGWAFERAGGNGANATSHEENCETSAIGRALANMGYATSRDDRPSRQEMGKVERHGGNELPPRARTTTQNTVPADAPSKEDPWTVFWREAKAAGLNNWDQIGKAIGQGQDAFRNGDEALAALRAFTQGQAA